MTERATFKYTGPEQEIRLGSETFRRDREVLVTDAATIKEARAHPEVAEEGPDGWVANHFPAEIAAEPAAPAPADPVPAPPAAPAKKRARAH